MKYLDSEQLNSISEQLKKCGIESPDLRAELTDHYAGEIEAQIEIGKSFDEAFAGFKYSNSWLKLRKLEHQHVEIKMMSFRSFLLNSLRDFVKGRKVWICYPLIAVLYFIVGLPDGKGEPLLFLIQVVSAGLALSIGIFCLKKGQRNLKLCGSLLSLAMFQLYLSVYLPVTNLVPWSHPVFDGFLLAQEVNTLYYAIWLWGIYVTLTYFRSTRQKLDIFSTAKS